MSVVCGSGADKQQNWEAVDAKVPETDKKLYYINVCDKIIKQEETGSCPEDAAVCAVGECRTFLTHINASLIRIRMRNV